MRIFFIFLVLFSLLKAEVKVLEILRVYDGDTFYVNLDCSEDILCKNLPIRLQGIDTPEIKSTGLEKVKAIKARDFVKDFLKKDFVLKDCKRDKYFRLNCRVISNDKDLTEELIKNKLGVPYDGGTKNTDWNKND